MRRIIVFASLLVLIGLTPITTKANNILAGWDVDLSSLDSAQVAAGLASAQSLAGTAVAPEVSILSGGPGGNGVDLSNVFTSLTTPTGVEIGLDNVGVGSSNMYRGIFAARDWFIEGVDDQGTPYPLDPTKYLSFQISSTSGFDLNSFELVARNQVQNTPSRVRNVYAAFSTDGVNFSDYFPPTADGDPNDDSGDGPPSELQGNFLVGPRGGPSVFTPNPHKIWDLSDYNGVTDLWIRVQARGLPNGSGQNVLNEDSWFAIDDRGDLNTATPLDLEANANNPFTSPFDTGSSDDGFDVILTGTAATGTPGDFDNDGDVDGIDFLQWQRNPGVSLLSDWQSNYGNPPGGSGVSVLTIPEPSSLTMVLLTVLSVCRARRIRHD